MQILKSANLLLPHGIDIKSFEISPFYLAHNYCSNPQKGKLLKTLGFLPQECWPFIPHALMCLINIKYHLCINHRTQQML